MSSVAILVAAVSSVAVGAQSGGTMAKGDKIDKREMMDANYTGCLEAGTAAGTFMLTHVATADHMGKDMMKKDAMAKDTMTKDAMAKDGMSHESMAPKTLTLTGSSVDLSKHLGHQVSLPGWLAHEKMDAMEKGTMGKSTSTFTVKSLKMIAATCS
jgi:pentapeptide MXKDX repeat protein